MPNLADRQRLGLAVKRARRRAGYETLNGAWHDVTGISPKTLGMLEAGDVVGDRVIFAVEDALGWPEGWAHAILDGRQDGPPGATPVVRDRTNVTLERATQDELLDELASRRRVVAEGA
ncbi:MAG TPA: hypothetical protein VIL68_05865 [Propionibacteriaceae bacterium]